MRIVVVGGDGYLGWPQALHLAAAGHQVRILDNLARRRFDADTGYASLSRWARRCDTPRG